MDATGDVRDDQKSVLEKQALEGVLRARGLILRRFVFEFSRRQSHGPGREKSEKQSFSALPGLGLIASYEQHTSGLLLFTLQSWFSGNLRTTRPCSGGSWTVQSRGPGEDIF